MIMKSKVYFTKEISKECVVSVAHTAAGYNIADKAFKELGWKAELGIEEMCSSLWNWQSKNPNGYKD